MATSSIIIVVLLVMQSRMVLIKAQLYSPTLQPSPYAYVKLYDPLTLEFTGGDTPFVFRAAFILNNVEIHRVNRKCKDTGLPWRLYEISCETTHGGDVLFNVTFTLVNVTEAMDGDVWKVQQFYGDEIDEEPAYEGSEIGMDEPPDYHLYTDTPMEVMHSPSTTIFIKGNITDTTVYVDEDNVMAVESLVTKMYPDVNELIQEITVVKVDTNNTDKEQEVMNGSATHDSTARADGLTKVVWKASTNMTDAEYNYTVTYSDIVLAENVEGSFCIGTACPTLTPTSGCPTCDFRYWRILLLLMLTKIN